MKHVLLALLLGCLLTGSALARARAVNGSDDRSKYIGPDPQPGVTAPDFELKTLKDPTKTVKLSSFRGKRPVVLVLSSFT